MGLFGLLFAIFLAFKLAGVAAISWLFVFAPLMVWAGLFVTLLVGAALAARGH
jgi:hypothetical protein